MAAAAAFAFALACASGVPGLADPDAFSHLSYARRLVESGFSLRGHPFLPFTVLGGTGVDLWLGFHWLLVPFVPLGDLWGARLAGACIAALVAGSVAWLVARLGRNPSWAFALAPFVLSTNFAVRGHVARPAQLTVPIVLFELAAGAGALHPLWAFALAFAHGLLHLSSPLSPLFALLGFMAARKSGSGRAVLWAVAGLGLALVLRPDRDLHTVLAGLTNLTALGFLTDGRLPHTGMELAAPGALQFLRDSWPGFALLGLACILGRGRQRSGSRELRTAALLALALAAVLMWRSLRFVDYLVPLQAVSAALFWPRDRPLAKPLIVALAIAAALLAQDRLRRVWITGSAYFDPPQTYSEIAAQVRTRVPPGAVIFTDDLFVSEILLSVLPEYRYIGAYDPAVLWLESPARFWRWHHAVVDGIDCPTERCAPRPPVGAEVARVLRSFDAQWAITSYPRGRRSAQETMAQDGKDFDLVAIVPGTATGLYLWEVRPGAGGAGVH